MDMRLNDEQRDLAETARRVMDAECGTDHVRAVEESDLGFSADMWARMAELGWLGLPVPPQYGGFGLGVVDSVVLSRELGRVLCPSPYISTVLFGAGAIAAAGSEAQKSLYLPRVVEGDLVISFAFQEPDCYYDYRGVTTRAVQQGGSWLLNGTKMFVEHARAAHLLLVVARTDGGPSEPDGLTMFLVEPTAAGLSIDRLPTMARDSQCEVVLRDVEVPEDAVLGPVGLAWPVLEPVVHKGVVTFCAYMAGAAARMHEMATSYAKDRVQFGRHIGSFQVIQGYLSQLIIEITGADALTYYAAWMLDRQRPARGVVAKTKSFVGDVLKRTTDIGSQIFGGIGYIEDVDSTLYLRRGKQYQLALGDTAYWQDIVTEEILDA